MKTAPTLHVSAIAERMGDALTILNPIRTT